MAKIALVCGINYVGTRSELAGCINDSNDWAEPFTARGFKTTKLMESDADNKNMRAAIKELVAKAKPGDSVIFQYSGHGSQISDLSGDEKSGFDQCICPYDVFSNGPIIDDELFSMYDNKPPGIKFVVISDSCHSGTVSRLLSIPETPVANRGKPRFMKPNLFPHGKDLAPVAAKTKGGKVIQAGRDAVLLMSGSQDVEFSYDAWFDGKANGAFSYSALRALEKMPVQFSYQRWYDEIRKALPSSQYPQTPNFLGSTVMKEWSGLA